MLQTPVLLLIFKRLETTKQVFEQIRKVQPERLYVAADGPRDKNPEEALECSLVRKWVVENIDWQCQVNYLFQEKNLGCGTAVPLAIDWFFNQEENGIILEDDCLPDPSFFIFCHQLLHYYQDDKKIMAIGGSNFQKGKVRGNASYYFSIYPHVWGWATWRRAWKCFDKNLDEIDFKFVQKWFKSKEEHSYWWGAYHYMLENKVNIWDYRWLFSVWKNEGIVVTPNRNLVINIGFGNGATNTINSDLKIENNTLESITQIIHPLTVKIDSKADKFSFRNHFHLPEKWSNKLRNIAYKILPPTLVHQWRKHKGLQ